MTAAGEAGDPGEIGKVGFVGLGAMGSRMAANLAKAGFELVCFDVADLEQKMPTGATAAASVAALAGQVDVVILSLPDGRVSAQVAEEIIESNQRNLRAVIDTSTIGIAAAQAVDARLGDAKIDYYDAPVSGGIAGAAAATIALMFAGSEEGFQTWQPVLGALSKKPIHVGLKAGQAQAMKLLNNFLSGMALTATSEAIAFGLTQGLEMETMIEVLNASSGQNTATSDKFPNRIATETYDARFLNTLYLKDLSLFVENSDAAGTVNLLGHALLPIWQRFVADQPGGDYTEIFPFVRDKS